MLKLMNLSLYQMNLKSKLFFISNFKNISSYLEAVILDNLNKEYLQNNENKDKIKIGLSDSKEEFSISNDQILQLMRIYLLSVSENDIFDSIDINCNISCKITNVLISSNDSSKIICSLNLKYLKYECSFILLIQRIKYDLDLSFHINKVFYSFNLISDFIIEGLQEDTLIVSTYEGDIFTYNLTESREDTYLDIIDLFFKNQDLVTIHNIKENQFNDLKSKINYNTLTKVKGFENSNLSSIEELSLLNNFIKLPYKKCNIESRIIGLRN